MPSSPGTIETRGCLGGGVLDRGAPLAGRNDGRCVSAGSDGAAPGGGETAEDGQFPDDAEDGVPPEDFGPGAAAVVQLIRADDDGDDWGAQGTDGEATELLDRD